MMLICKQCNKQFIPKNRSKHNQQYCSKDCQYIASRKKIDCVCRYCGKQFTKQPNQIENGEGKYCSQECHYADNTKKKIFYCGTCGKEVITNQKRAKYCSLECANRGMSITKKISPGGWAKGGTRKDLGETWFRSSWEANYARHLNRLKERYFVKSWEYEPHRFILSKSCYIPDFKVTDIKGNISYHEVKGYMTKVACQKLDEMKVLYPEANMVLIDKPVYKNLEKMYSSRIPNWEVS